MSRYKALTPKQEAFCVKYLETGNASEAYRLSYNAGKMKPNSVNRNAHALLKNAKVASRLAALTKPAEDEVGITIKRVLKEAARLAFVDVRKLYNADGTMKAPHQIDDDTAAALSSLETVEDVEQGSDGETLLVNRTKKVKLIDKNAALDRLFKYLRLYGPSNDQPPALPDGVTEVTIRLSAVDRIMVTATGGGASGGVSVVRQERPVLPGPVPVTPRAP